MKPSRRQQYADFSRDFSNLCRDWHGVESPSHDIGVAFRFETRFGPLWVSIHTPHGCKSDELCAGSIFLRFETYTGPARGPNGHCEQFNRFSHKWNIHCSGEPQESRANALMELYRRLNLVTEHKQIV